MRVLGLGTEGDSGAAVVEDGRILAAINEERLSRMKLVEGFPRASIRSVLRLSDTGVEDLDLVLVGGTMELFSPELRPFTDWFSHWDRPGLGGLIKRVAGKLSRLRKYLPFMESAYYAMLAPSFRKRRRGVERILRNEFGVGCPVHFVDHHTAHVASAYLSSGYRDALIVSLDGGGDGLSGMVASMEDGEFRILHRVSAFNSLGNYYAYITHICGFKAMKHEGKITGLAAHGDPKYVDLLDDFITYRSGTFVNRAGVVFGEAIRELNRRLPADVAREDLAASIQVHTENLVRQLVGYWRDRTGLENVALAGGIFANVRINQEVLELEGVRRIHVHPHMGDGGLTVGAACAAAIPGLTPVQMPNRHEAIPDVFLGTDLPEDEIDAALAEHELEPEVVDGDLADRVAELLAAGHVVARAAGRMEYGPRALGNRTIMYHPTDAAVNDWLNDNLKRTEFMPFAPVLLAEEASKCFDGYTGAEHAAEFMTVTFDCTPWMKRNMPGVVHVDGTARPQLVKKDTENTGYREILEAFQRRTGLPGFINTSFNMHEEPIVASAEDAVRAFLQGNLDYLLLGDRLIAHPAGVQHPMKPVIEAEADSSRRIAAS